MQEIATIQNMPIQNMPIQNKPVQNLPVSKSIGRGSVGRNGVDSAFGVSQPSALTANLQLNTNFYSDNGRAVDAPRRNNGLRALILQLTQILSQIKTLLSTLSSATPTEPTQPGPTQPGPTQPGPDCNRTKGDLPFQTKIREFLQPDQNGSISEARLQYGIAAFQLYQKDPAIEAAFQSEFRAATEVGMSTEEAVKRALRKVRDDGLIKKWEADWTYAVSYRAAQLDNALSELSAQSTPTENFDAAAFKAEVALAYIQGGTIIVPNRGL